MVLCVARKFKMTQGSMPLRDSALSYFRSGYGSKKLGELWDETNEYMDSAFPETEWGQIVSRLRRPKPSDVQDFVKKTANSADDFDEPAA
jgi:hypothetical protein